jgi:hypothetical protein
MIEIDVVVVDVDEKNHDHDQVGRREDDRMSDLLELRIDHLS